MLLINPGSQVAGGTEEQARLNAEPFLAGIHRMGMHEVVIDPNPTYEDGRWTFTFRHPVTKKTATVSTHGLTVDEARALLFAPRIYWNGCSVSEPKVSDFLPDGWTFQIVFRPIDEQEAADKELEARTDRNAELISAFMEHAALEGVTIPNSVFESFFDA